MVSLDELAPLVGAVVGDGTVGATVGAAGAVVGLAVGDKPVVAAAGAVVGDEVVVAAGGAACGEAQPAANTTTAFRINAMRINRLNMSFPP
jgi:hypothetical protein